MRSICYPRDARESNRSVAGGRRLRSTRRCAQRGHVHPLLLVTLLGPLVALFGLVGQMAHRAHAPSDTERGAAAGVAGLKRLVAAGDWGAALPPLMITGGLLWTMTLGAIAMAVVFEQRVTGLLMLAVPLWAAGRIVRDYRRA